MTARTQEWLDVRQLVLSAQRGDRTAFGALVVRFQDWVLNLARRRERDVHEAAELTQEVFLHALRKLHQLRDPDCFAGWLRQITARVAINRATRRRMPTLGDHSTPVEVFAKEASPVESAMNAERGMLIRAAIRRLRPMDREVLMAFYLREQPVKQIARQLGVPVGTVKRRLHVARQRLQKKLAGNLGLEAAPVGQVSATTSPAPRALGTAEPAEPNVETARPGHRRVGTTMPSQGVPLPCRAKGRAESIGIRSLIPVGDCTAASV